MYVGIVFSLSYARLIRQHHFHHVIAVPVFTHPPSLRSGLVCWSKAVAAVTIVDLPTFRLPLVKSVLGNGVENLTIVLDFTR